MNNIIKYIGGGIKCDNPECDYVDPNVSLEEYIMWLNKPCPKCGANLLTQADYDNVLYIMDVVNAINRACPVSDEYEEDSFQTLMHIAMDGTGRMDISVDVDDDIKKSACEQCPTNIKNGGDGICNCILGQPQITY